MDKKITKALELFKKQDYQKAIDAFSQILETTTDNAELYNNLALCYSYTGEIDKAEKFYLKALNINPKLPQVYINLADLYFKQKNFSSAIDLLVTGCYELPENLVLAHYLARVYMEDARLYLAIDELNKIIEAQSENYDAYYDLARVYFELGHWDLAISNFESVLEYKEDNEWIYYYLAQAYEANNEVDKAICNYLKAINVEVTFHPAYKKLGVLFMARDDFEDAIEYFEEYLKFEIPEEEKTGIRKVIERIKLQKK